MNRPMTRFKARALVAESAFGGRTHYDQLGGFQRILVDSIIDGLTQESADRAPHAVRTTMLRWIGTQLITLTETLGALKFGTFVLNSGDTSSYYFDGRLLTLDGRGALLVGAAMSVLMKDYRVRHIGGPTLGADPIVGAALASDNAHELGRQMSQGFLVRPQAKDHGKQRKVEGHLGKRVLVVDDACSTGGSLFHTIHTVESLGCQVAAVAVILDRKEGGSDEIRARYPFITLLEADERGTIKVAV